MKYGGSVTSDNKVFENLIRGYYFFLVIRNSTSTRLSIIADGPDWPMNPGERGASALQKLPFEAVRYLDAVIRKSENVMQLWARLLVSGATHGQRTPYYRFCCWILQTG